MGEQLKVTVNANDLKSLACTCGAIVFETVFTYKIIPALYSQTGKTSFMSFPVLRCIACNNLISLEETAKNV